MEVKVFNESGGVEFLRKGSDPRENYEELTEGGAIPFKNYKFSVVSLRHLILHRHVFNRAAHCQCVCMDHNEYRHRTSPRNQKPVKTTLQQNTYLCYNVVHMDHLHSNVDSIHDVDGYQFKSNVPSRVEESAHRVCILPRTARSAKHPSRFHDGGDVYKHLPCSDSSWKVSYCFTYSNPSPRPLSAYNTCINPILVKRGGFVSNYNQ